MIHDLASHTAAQLDSDEMLYKQVALRISELIEHGTLRPRARSLGAAVQSAAERQHRHGNAGLSAFGKPRPYRGPAAIGLLRAAAALVSGA